jgi:hypothetical protein
VFQMRGKICKISKTKIERDEKTWKIVQVCGD